MPTLDLQQAELVVVPNSVIGPGAVNAMASNMASNTVMERLDLSDVRIGPKGVKTLVKALRKNTKLGTLKISDTLLGKPALDVGQLDVGAPIKSVALVPNHGPTPWILVGWETTLTMMDTAGAGDKKQSWIGDGFACVSPNGVCIAIASVDHSDIAIWQVQPEDTQYVKVRDIARDDEGGSISSMCFSMDNRWLIWGTEDGQGALYDLLQGKFQEYRLPDYGASIQSVSLTIHGSDKIAAVVYEHVVTTQKLPNFGLGWEDDTVLRTPSANIVQYSRTDILAVGCKMGECNLYRVAEEDPYLRVEAVGGILSMCFSDDGKMLATGGMTGVVSIFDTVSGHCGVEVRAGSNAIITVCFVEVHHSLKLMSVDTAGYIRYWDPNFPGYVSGYRGYEGIFPDLLMYNRSLTSLDLGTLPSNIVAEVEKAMKYNYTLKELLIAPIRGVGPAAIRAPDQTIAMTNFFTDKLGAHYDRGVLDLSGCRIGTGMVDLLCNKIHEVVGDHITHLYLDDNDLGKLDVGRLSDRIAQFPSLRALRLNNNPLGPDIGVEIATLINSNTISELYLANTDINDDVVSAVVDVLSKADPRRKIQTIDLSGNNIPYVAGKRLEVAKLLYEHKWQASPWDSTSEDVKSIEELRAWHMTPGAIQPVVPERLVQGVFTEIEESLSKMTQMSKARQYIVAKRLLETIIFACPWYDIMWLLRHAVHQSSEPAYSSSGFIQVLSRAYNAYVHNTYLSGGKLRAWQKRDDGTMHSEERELNASNVDLQLVCISIFVGTMRALPPTEPAIGIRAHILTPVSDSFNKDTIQVTDERKLPAVLGKDDQNVFPMREYKGEQHFRVDEPYAENDGFNAGEMAGLCALPDDVPWKFIHCNFNIAFADGQRPEAGHAIGIYTNGTSDFIFDRNGGSYLNRHDLVRGVTKAVTFVNIPPRPGLLRMTEDKFPILEHSYQEPVGTSQYLYELHDPDQPGRHILTVKSTFPTTFLVQPNEGDPPWAGYYVEGPDRKYTRHARDGQVYTFDWEEAAAMPTAINGEIDIAHCTRNVTMKHEFDTAMAMPETAMKSNEFGTMKPRGCNTGTHVAETRFSKFTGKSIAIGYIGETDIEMQKLLERARYDPSKSVNIMQVADDGLPNHYYIGIPDSSWASHDGTTCGVIHNARPDEAAVLRFTVRKVGDSTLSVILEVIGCWRTCISSYTWIAKPDDGLPYTQIGPRAYISIVPMGGSLGTCMNYTTRHAVGMSTAQHLLEKSKRSTGPASETKDTTLWLELLTGGLQLLWGYNSPMRYTDYLTMCVAMSIYNDHSTAEELAFERRNAERARKARVTSHWHGTEEGSGRSGTPAPGKPAPKEEDKPRGGGQQNHARFSSLKF